MSISFDMLTAFVKVAEHASVSAAAISLGTGKSVISKRIAQLEAAVSATLFSRSTRKVALTTAGEAYLVYARRAIDEISAADESLRALRSDLSGQIRITACVSWGQRVLAKKLPEFFRLHPGIQIELLLADRMMDIAYERVDIALRWTATESSDFSTCPIARIEWVVVAAPSYLAAAGAPSVPSELAVHHCLNYWRESSDDVWAFVQDRRTDEVRVRSRYHANNPEAVADAALAGLGIALLPSYLCEAEIAQGKLVPLLSAWTPRTKFGLGISAVVTPERMRLKRNQALLAFLRERLEVNV
jgi:DNA-binding transcriptional LysR family regulator